MIPTLCSNGFLYKVNRNRIEYLTAIEKRRAVWMLVGFSACVTIATMVIRYGIILFWHP